MRRSLAILALLGSTSLAFAADLPPTVYPTKAPLVAAYYNWAGLYVGGNVGYGTNFNDLGIQGDDTNSVTVVATGIVPSTLRTDPHGWLGGATIGYNFTQGPWVYGLETDGQLASIKGDASQTLSGAPVGIPVGISVSGHSELNWFGTFRGRFGIAPYDGTTLFYATGGLAYGGVKTSLTGNVTVPAPVTNLPPPIIEDGVRVGWTAGGGIEHALWGSKWTVKAEYLYTDLGNDRASMAGTVNGTPFSFTANQPEHFHIVRLGAAYRFAPY